jgi:hypothetical protein
MQKISFIATIHASIDFDIWQELSQMSFEECFKLLHAASMGFFQIIFYALNKSDFLLEKSRLADYAAKYDSASGLEKIKPSSSATRSGGQMSRTMYESRNIVKAGKNPTPVLKR